MCVYREIERVCVLCVCREIERESVYVERGSVDVER